MGRLAPLTTLSVFCVGAGPELGSAQKPKEVNESSLHELYEVHKVDSVVENVIVPEGGPEKGLISNLVEPRPSTKSLELGLSSIWVFRSGKDRGGSSCERKQLI